MKTMLLVLILAFCDTAHADERTKLHIIAGAACQTVTDFLISKSMQLKGNERYYSLLMSVPFCNLLSVAYEGAQSYERRLPFDAGDHAAFSAGQALGVGLKFALEF